MKTFTTKQRHLSAIALIAAAAVTMSACGSSSSGSSSTSSTTSTSSSSSAAATTSSSSSASSNAATGSDSSGSATSASSSGGLVLPTVDGDQSQYTIGVSVADQKSLFYIAEVDGIKKAAADTGAKVIVLSADNNSTQQVNQINDLITQQVDALIFTAQDATSAAAGVKAANKAKIPVIAVDQKPESGDGQLATYIATDSVKAADALCTWVFKQMGGSGEIGILQGVLGATAELQRSQGCKQALDANPNIKVVAEQSANWDETEGYKAAQNMLQANPDLKAIVGESDAMGLGAAKAAKDAGRTIISVGIDGFPTMITGIQQGLTQATQAQIPYKMGQLAVLDSLLILGGKASEVPAEQYQDTVLVTSDNVSSVNPVDFYGPNVK